VTARQESNLSSSEASMAQTLFMIHGMWGNGRHWDKFKDFLELRGYACVCPTLPYHDMDPRAQPDPRLGTTSLLDYAAFLEGEIGKLDAPPVVVGHSMGGLLAQMLGARGLARALVLLTPASPAGILAFTPNVVRAFWSVQTSWGFWSRPMRQTFAEAAFSILHQFPPEEQRREYDSFVYESGRAAVEIGYWLFDARHATRVDETKITCPALVVGGGEDRIVPASVVRQVARKYAAVAQYKEFKGQAHMVLRQPGWEEVAGFVAGWLAQAAPA
jgi:pimeloyl-ACP methyl ester carboxylesterase